MSLASLWQEYRRASSQAKVAQQTYDKAAQALEDYKNSLRHSLPLTEDCPCKVANLGDGWYAVHVWVASASESNQLHLVHLSDLKS